MRFLEPELAEAPPLLDNDPLLNKLLKVHPERRYDQAPLTPSDPTTTSAPPREQSEPLSAPLSGMDPT